MSDPGTTYVPAWVSNRAGHAPGGAPESSWRFGAPCASAAEAQRVLRAERDAGRATLTIVVEVRGTVRTPLVRTVKPEWARKVVLHLEALWDLVDPPAAT